MDTSEWKGYSPIDPTLRSTNVAVGSDFLHEAVGSRRQLAGLQESTGGLTIDLAGYGGREIPEGGLSFDHLQDDIDGVFDEEKRERAHFFGYRMGGCAALLYAAGTPNARSIVAAGTEVLWTDEGLRKALR